MRSARTWKQFYADERASLGEPGLTSLLDRAPAVTVPKRGALVIPHTRLEASGELIAAAANAVVRSGAPEVLALGVLHGGREADSDLVARARAGEEDAVRALRRVHGPGAPDDAGHWSEEFSLDAFMELTALAARRVGRQPPRIVARYPFLAGNHPDDLPGLDELQRLYDGGIPVVATTDPIHHGVGYGTPPDRWRPRTVPSTEAWARATIEDGFRLLTTRSYDAFLAQAAETRSDFRDTGPALAAVLTGTLRAQLHELVLVNYAEVLKAAEPTWVAGALSAFVAER